MLPNSTAGLISFERRIFADGIRDEEFGVRRGL
jgi:hypothetical protein